MITLIMCVCFHNQNHRGAMTELGEGLAKLRKQRFRMGPFQRFEQEMSEVLEYIYNTQLEHAACKFSLSKHLAQ